MTSSLLKQEEIESKIYNIRGVEVMLDSDLAEQYKCVMEQRQLI